MEPTNLLSVLEERPEYPDLLHRLGVGEFVELNIAHNLHLEEPGCMSEIKFLNTFITIQNQNCE